MVCLPGQGVPLQTDEDEDAEVVSSLSSGSFFGVQYSLSVKRAIRCFLRSRGYRATRELDDRTVSDIDPHRAT